MRLRAIVVLAIAAGCVCAAALHDPIPQDPRYHQFADKRTLFGIPNFWNVVSNAAFLITGLAGLLAMRRNAARGPLDPAYLTVFAGLILVAFGSAWYHLSPDNGRLTWDRLPMTLVFMGFLAVVIGERIDPRLGRSFLPFLLLAGVASVVYWKVSERVGHGDLRPYFLIQFLPLLLIPLITILFSRPSSNAWPVWGMLAAYVAAKILELCDARLFQWHELISGHTLKHLMAAAGVYFLVKLNFKT